MSEGADHPGVASGESTRSPVGPPAGPGGSADPDRIFSARPPSVAWDPADKVPPAPGSRAQARAQAGSAAAAWFKRGNTAAAPPAGAALAAATTSGEIDIETWLRLSGETDAEAPPRPTWTLSTGQFPLVGTGQFPIVTDGRRPGQATRFDHPAEISYRWRTLLGLGMALLLTVAVVVAYRGSREHVVGIPPKVTAGAANQSSGLNAPAVLTNQPGSPNPAAPGVISTNATPGGGANPTSPAGTTTGPDGPTVPDTTVDGGPDSSIGAAAAAITAADTPTTGASTAATAGGTGTGSPALTPITGPGATAPVLAAGAATATGPESTTARPGPQGGPPGRPTRVDQHLDAARLKLQGGASLKAEVAGFDGGGYVANLMAPGSGVTWTVDSEGPASVATLHVRYSAGNDATVGPRTLTVMINGNDGPVLRMPITGDWSTWLEATVKVNLPPGHPTLGLVVRAGDTGFVYLDSISLN